MPNKAIHHPGSFESTSNASSYTDLAGAYLDLDAGGTYAQVGAKGPGSIGLKLRTVLAGVALTVMTFTSAGAATMAGSLATNGSLQLLTNVAAPAGGFGKSASQGLVVAGVTGSTNDLLLVNGGGGSVLWVPAGTLNVGMGGALAIAGALLVSFANPDVNGIQLTATTGTNAAAMKFVNTGSNCFLGLDNATGTRLLASGGTGGYQVVLSAEGAVPLVLGTNNIGRMIISSAGAATFSSTLAVTGTTTHSVTSNGYDIGFQNTNLSAGAAASAAYQLTNDGAKSALIRIYGTGFTTTGYQVADSMLVYTNAAGGIHYQSGSTHKFWDPVTVVGAVQLSTNATYLQGVTTGAVTKNLIGVNASDVIQLDPNAVSVQTGGQFTVGVHGTTGIQIIDNGTFGTLNNIALLLRTNATSAVTISTAQAVRFHAYVAGTATFDASGNITSVSDERHKADIQPFTRGLSALRGLTPITHRYNALSKMEMENRYPGFSAQNVREFVPEAVFARPSDGILSLYDRGLLGVLVNASKELDGLVSDHERRLIQLEARSA